MSTLERMNNLLPGVSIPRDVSRANHDGSNDDPLQSKPVKHDNEGLLKNLHLAT